MASPAARDITIWQGDTYRHVVTLTTDGSTPIDITGRTYDAQIRNRSTDAMVLELTCAVTDEAGGEVTVSASPAETAALTVGSYLWDLQETASGDVTTLLAGTVTVRKDVTR